MDEKLFFQQPVVSCAAVGNRRCHAIFANLNRWNDPQYGRRVHVGLLTSAAVERVAADDFLCLRHVLLKGGVIGREPVIERIAKFADFGFPRTPA